MSDVREMLSLLTPGAVNLDRSGGGSDIRQRLLAAMARVRPTWAGYLLLARYAGDNAALRTVERAMLTELASAVWPDKPKPGTLRGVVSMVLCEYVDPPPCLSCAGTASTWRMVDGAVKAIDCPACGGSGRRRATDDELTQISGLPAGKWAPRYAALHRLLRTHERAALSTMREALSEVPAGA